MQHYADGGKVEVCDRTWKCWSTDLEPLWDWVGHNYRIKEKPKQTVTIEKWLCKDAFGYFVVHCQNKAYESIKVKLLDTYEVEL